MKTATPRKSLPQPLLAPLTDDLFLVQTLCELTSQDQDTVRRRLQREEQRLGSNVSEAMSKWQLQPYVWSEKLIEFYQSTDAFLFETLVWNRHPLKNAMRAWIGAYLQREHDTSVRVLTYGDGLGIDSLYCALAGHHVDYYEVSEQCVEFSKRLAMRLDSELKTIRKKELIASASYDYVVCLDVLEHVPDPPAVVAEMAGYLKPGGKLIVHAPFWYISPAVSTHLATNLTYSGDIKRLYLSNGLMPVDASAFWNPIVLQKVDHSIAQRPVLSFSRRVKINASGLLLKGARIWKWPYQVGAWMSVQQLNKPAKRS